MEDQETQDTFGEDLTDDIDNVVKEKPARKTKRRKTVKADEGEDGKTVVESSEETEATKTPKRKATRRRKAVEAATEEETETKPKPKPRKRRTKRSSDAELEEWNFEEVTDDDNESVPVSRKESPERNQIASSKEESSQEESSTSSEEFESDTDRPKNNHSQSNKAPQYSDGNDDGGGNRRRRRRRRRNNKGGNEGGGGGGGRNQSRGGNRNRNNNNNNNNNNNRSSNRRTRSSEYTGEEITGTIEGVLELHPKGYGFLRDPLKNYMAQDSDAFVSSSVIEKYRLREGILIRGEVGPGTRGQGPRLKNIETVDGRTLDAFQELKHFDDLTAINPHEQIRLETGPRPITMRVMDLLTPIGKGQRALIVAPPRTGKTMLLHDIAHAVSVNHPEMHLMVLLIDERPEEVTEMKRNVKGEVIASSMDRDVESHVRISQLIVERGKRIAEAGGEVFILLDSITRTARAFNKWVGNSGRTATGGLDIRALDIPKKLFGTARRFEEGGSLTVAGTALIETGSRMDEVIFQEFKGTGNMELVLSRDLADRRIWPSIDITRSGTRREEKLFDEETLDTVTMLRRSLISLSPVEAMEQLTRKLDMFPSNREFLTKVRNVL